MKNYSQDNIQSSRQHWYNFLYLEVVLWMPNELCFLNPLSSYKLTTLAISGEDIFEKKILNG